MTIKPATRAIILAAGEGKRLAGVQGNAPKGLIEINGEPLVSRSLRLLHEHGVDTVVIVAGYAGQYYEALAQRLQRQFSRMDIHIAYNHDYSATTTMQSLQIGIQSLQSTARSKTSALDAAIVAESDLLYESRALAALQSQAAANVLLTSGPTHAGDEVYVAGHGTNLCGLSKWRESLSGDIIGELVGLTRIATRSLDWLGEYAKVVGHGEPSLTYEDALTALSAVHPVHCELIDDLVWTEIDNGDHLKRAIETIGPWIAEFDQALPGVAGDIA